MPIPDFVKDLREKIGTAPLWLAGATAVVVDSDRILLIRRADTGAWTPITGIIDPGEEPAVTLVREALEEANVHIGCSGSARPGRPGRSGTTTATRRATST